MINHLGPSRIFTWIGKIDIIWRETPSLCKYDKLFPCSFLNLHKKHGYDIHNRWLVIYVQMMETYFKNETNISVIYDMSIFAVYMAANKVRSPHNIFVPIPAATISCDFEEPYICGYEPFSAISGFTWMYWEGRTASSYTGPNEDHTMGGESGGKLCTIFITERSSLPYSFQIEALPITPFVQDIPEHKLHPFVQRLFVQIKLASILV